MRAFVRLAALAVMVAPIAAWSQADSKKDSKGSKSLHEQFTGQGYGVAGCGLGSIVFGPKQGMVQVFASTTNGIYSNQIFGISSGTSNCDIPTMGQEAAAFIEVNQESFRKEVARGGGETVEGVAHILKCSDAKLLGEQMQMNSERLLEGGIDTYETTRRVLHTIKSNPVLHSTCQVVGETLS